MKKIDYDSLDRGRFCLILLLIMVPIMVANKGGCPNINKRDQEDSYPLQYGFRISRRNDNRFEWDRFEWIPCEICLGTLTRLCGDCNGRGSTVRPAFFRNFSQKGK
jgi:hypothetical protein